MQVSEHVSLREATKSMTARGHGIKNKPNMEEFDNMKLVSRTVFEPLRKALGDKPIGIASFYRNYRLNELIGGAPGSQHTTGEAMDIDADIVGYQTNKEIFEWIYNNAIFDQLINEFPDDEGEPEWVHVSKTNGKGNRGEVLVAFEENGEVKYKYYNG